ncbi:hypothetical protein ACFXGT_35205 [Streptomyces sp. NPDC059352]|uniref:hypothetical protein n=1 Tax=Streptomyces sp. NPDC059352 TaxID=3346810 RepID=UPI0036C78DF7
MSSSHPAERPTAAAWPRVVRLGAPGPGPAARRARWFGVPLVPVLVAALVVGAFTFAGGWDGHEGAVEGRAGGDPLAVPSPVVAEGDALRARTPMADTPSTGVPSTGTPSTGNPAADTPEAGTPEAGTPTRSVPGKSSAREEDASPLPSRTASAAPAAPSTVPSTAPPRTPSPARPVSFEALRVGECFDIDRATPGTALRRACDTPHHAELVARPRLTGTYADDQKVREAATELCRAPLRRKAARQPLGTRWTTFVQYPFRTSYLLGSDTVACSLAATGGRLTDRLR